MCVCLAVTLLFLVTIFKTLESQSTEHGCWPSSIVPFNIDPSFAQHEVVLIQDRMRHISDSSCLRFVDMNEVHPPSKELPLKYLLIRPTSDTYCSMSEEQRNSSLVVTVELGAGCTTRRGILHELVHALGFKHEHQRVDRKCYVTIYRSKEAPEGKAYAVDFNNPDNDWLEQFPYDKLSIMHHSRTGKMRAKSERWFIYEPLGSAEGHLTWFDLWKINYKHCSVVHYCDVYPEHCYAMDELERLMGCFMFPKNTTKI